MPRIKIRTMPGEFAKRGDPMLTAREQDQMQRELGRVSVRLKPAKAEPKKSFHEKPRAYPDPDAEALKLRRKREIAKQIDRLLVKPERRCVEPAPRPALPESKMIPTLTTEEQLERRAYIEEQIALNRKAQVKAAEREYRAQFDRFGITMAFALEGF